MQLPDRPTPAVRSTLRRALAVTGVVATAALVAVGCGAEGGGGGGGESGIVGDEGPLAWLPADTWLVATVNADAEAIDEAVQTLDRLPAWSLAESFLPASDGAGLRRELLEQVARSATDGGADAPSGEGDDAKPRVSAARLEEAFGNRAGVAITSTDFEAFDDDEGSRAPVAIWIEVDDEDAARDAMTDLTKGVDNEVEHAGVSYVESGKDEGAYLVRDGLLVAAPSGPVLEGLIDVREGDESLADDETAQAVIEASIGDALAGVALQSGPLMEAAPELIARAAEESEDPRKAARAKAIAEDLGPVLESKAVDGLVADWTGGSLTIDDTGLVIRGAWSNPRDLAEPEIGSRELVERAPADAPVVQAMVSDGSEVRRVQDAWSEVREAYDLDLRSFAAQCPAANRWACDLGLEAAVALLEDESLADASEEAGDTSAVIVQDLAPMLAQAARLGANPGARAAKPESRVYEFAISGRWPKWRVPQELRAAATRAGLLVRADKERSQLTVRVAPGSPMARALRQADPSLLQAVGLVGIDLRAMQSPAGVTFRSETVDGLQVIGLPPDAPSKLARSLAGDADVLGDAEAYGETVDAAGPPDEVGVYGYIDVRGLAEGVVTALGSQAPDLQRIVPTLRNNLADVPGMLFWTAREEVEGEQVGTFEAVMPILE